MLPRSPRWRGAGGSGCRFTKEKSGLCHRPDKKTPPLRPSLVVRVNGGGFRSLVQVGFFSTPGHAPAPERSGRDTKRSDWRDRCSRTGDEAKHLCEKSLPTLRLWDQTTGIGIAIGGARGPATPRGPLSELATPTTSEQRSNVGVPRILLHGSAMFSLLPLFLP